MMIFDEASDFLWPSAGWARKNRNSLAQFMRQRTRVVWPASAGTYRRQDEPLPPYHPRLRSKGKLRRAKLKALRQAREQMATKENAT